MSRFHIRPYLVRPNEVGARCDSLSDVGCYFLETEGLYLIVFTGKKEEKEELLLFLDPGFGFSDVSVLFNLMDMCARSGDTPWSTGPFVPWDRARAVGGTYRYSSGEVTSWGLTTHAHWADAAHDLVPTVTAFLQTLKVIPPLSLKR